MDVQSGDKVRMVDLRTGNILQVVVISVKGAKAIVEDAHGPKPRRTWQVGTGFLAPLHQEATS